MKNRSTPCFIIQDEYTVELQFLLHAPYPLQLCHISAVTKNSMAACDPHHHYPAHATATLAVKLVKKLSGVFSTRFNTGPEPSRHWLNQR
jgi:hypothetical protein